MAKFSVAAANGTTAVYDGTYKVTQGGVLSVLPDNGNPVVFSPAGWLGLEVKDAINKPGDVKDVMSAT